MADLKLVYGALSLDDAEYIFSLSSNLIFDSTFNSSLHKILYAIVSG